MSFLVIYLRNRDDLERNGVPVANAVASVAFNDDGKVLSFGRSFVELSTITTELSL